MESESYVLTQPLIPPDIVEESNEQKENIELNENIGNATINSICALREGHLNSGSKHSSLSRRLHGDNGTTLRSSRLRIRSRSGSKGSESNSRRRSRSGSNSFRTTNSNRSRSGLKQVNNCSRGEEQAKLNKRPNVTDAGKVDKEQSGNSASEHGNVNVINTKKSSAADVTPKSINKKSDDFSEVSDFDAMFLCKKQWGRTARRKFEMDIDNENENLIDQLITNMKSAFDEDRQLKLCGKLATKKISMLKAVMSQLIKKDLQLSFIEHNVLDVLADWLAPLPDKTLPCYDIRESILKLLLDFPPIDKSYLKRSGIGKVVNYLSKHADETEENRNRAAHLISQWARSIFDINDNLKTMTRVERRERQLAQMPKLRLSCEPKPTTPTEKKVTFESSIEGKNQSKAKETSLEARARIPSPSRKDYVIRPKSNLEQSVHNIKKKPSLLQKHMKKFTSQKRLKQSKPVEGLSVDGRKMPL
ncbi:protein IWS1 homolog [Teleopsis dalmanni]|uniref:protein IWS1 homolog n=1 Tax=Teleopsis dalmanni TaxID=139649 RepID=UPI0018CE5B49|nr:protein IWS1 homolog [Teleopsis dalmanni]